MLGDKSLDFEILNKSSDLIEHLQRLIWQETSILNQVLTGSESGLR